MFDVVRKAAGYKQSNNTKILPNKPPIGQYIINTQYNLTLLNRIFLFVAIHKTSSGVSTLSRQSTDEIEFNSAAHGSIHKKIKLDSLKGNQDLLQNSLDFLNITKPGAENCHFPKAKDDEFDAFADFLSSPKGNYKNTEQENLQFEDNENESKDNSLSQLFNTQAINEMEKTINKAKVDTEDDCNFKLPLMKSFKEKIKPKETNLDQEIGERSVLFEDDKITSQYRQEVDLLFDEIEQSIYTMGMENVERKVPDKLLDIIFNDDLTNQPNKDSETPSDLSGSNLLSLSNFNMSFGTVIKTALLNNATKSVQPKKVLDSTLNATLSERTVEFKNLGPFYGLPLKVKDLIKQYKGIEELYGN